MRMLSEYEGEPVQFVLPAYTPAVDQEEVKNIFSYVYCGCFKGQCSQIINA